jgi:hypothetical protein
MLSYEQARQCYALIKQSSLMSLRLQLFRDASNYARIRATYLLSSYEERIEMDQRRTLAHNAFIDSVNIMSRNMDKENEDNLWRAVLGDDRKIIGDFACYVHMFLGLEAR